MKNEINMVFPSELVEKLENLFKNDKIDFNKVLFTVYFINRGKWNSLKIKHENYQEVSSRYGNWISLVGKKGPDFLNKLVQGGIIKKTAGYVTAKHYTRYALCTPFNTENKDAKSDKYKLYTLTPENGAFVTKYINDGYIVRIPSASSGSKPKEAAETSKKIEVTTNTTEVEELRAILIAQQNQINEMMKQIENMKNMMTNAVANTVTKDITEDYTPIWEVDAQGNLIFTAVDVEVYDMRQEEATAKLKAMLAELNF